MTILHDSDLSVTYDWQTDAGESGVVTARMKQQRPSTAGRATERSGRKGMDTRPLCVHRPTLS